MSTDSSPDPAPDGFSLIHLGADELLIRHKRSGMGCMNAFLVCWLAGWTVVCVWLAHSYLHGGKMEDGSPMPLWFVLIFWGVELVVAGLLAYVLYGRKAFHIDWTALTMETDVLGLRWRKKVPKAQIERFVQVKDGGEDDDSFPSWGLKVEYGKKLTLLFRQPYEKSHWLGTLLAQWAGVAFVEAARENTEQECHEADRGAVPYAKGQPKI